MYIFYTSFDIHILRIIYTPVVTHGIPHVFTYAIINVDIVYPTTAIIPICHTLYRVAGVYFSIPHISIHVSPMSVCLSVSLSGTRGQPRVSGDGRVKGRP